MIDICDRNPGSPEAVFNRMRRETGTVLDAVEALFFDSGDQLAVANNRGRGISVVSINAENVHKIPWGKYAAALPPHTAVRLCLTGIDSLCLGRLRLTVRRGAASTLFCRRPPVSRRLTAMCGGKAATRFSYIRWIAFATLSCSSDRRSANSGFGSSATRFNLKSCSSSCSDNRSSANIR